jgi:hypothetical protein
MVGMTADAQTVVRTMSEQHVPVSFDAGVRRPHLSFLGHPARGGLAARTVASAPTALRTGPSRAAAINLLQKALAAVDMRLVHCLNAPSTAKKPGPLQVELALLSRLDRSLRAQLQAVADDVVLCDSMAEFAEGVHSVLTSLDGTEAVRAACLLTFLRDLLSELVAHKSAKAAPLKHKMLRSKTLLQQANASRGVLHSRQVTQVMQSTCALFTDVSAELERLCPRPNGGMLQQLLGS